MRKRKMTVIHTPQPRKDTIQHGGKHQPTLHPRERRKSNTCNIHSKPTRNQLSTIGDITPEDNRPSRGTTLPTKS